MNFLALLSDFLLLVHTRLCLTAILQKVRVTPSPFTKRFDPAHLTFR